MNLITSTPRALAFKTGQEQDSMFGQSDEHSRSIAMKLDLVMLQ